DPRCDLFSLGCVLYHAATGRVPFEGSDMYSLLMNLAFVDPPSPRDLCPEVPSSLAELIRRLLAKNRADRPPSAEVVVKALLAIERSQAYGTAAEPESAPTITARELRDALRQVDPAAVLVSPRIIVRLIQALGKLPSQFTQPPHRKTFVIDRHLLFRHVDQ